MSRLIIALICFVFPLVSCTNIKTVKPDIVVWHWMTDRQAAFEEIAARYLKATGVKVAFETYAPSEIYSDKIRAAAGAGVLPDIYSPLGDKNILATFIKSGFIADLTEEMNKGWKDIFFEKPLSQNAFELGGQWNDIKPGIYGVPIDVSSLEIYYNKDIFKQAGLDPEKPPETWDQFIDAGKKLRAKGIQPFVSGFGEGWLVGAFFEQYEWNLMGKQGVLDTIGGKIKYTDPRWIRIFKLVEEMRDSNMLASGMVTMVNKDAERTFATGSAAMCYNGSWAVNVFYSMNPDLNYGVMMPPSLIDAKFPIKILGGTGSSFYVNNNSKNKDKAIEFLKWLTQEDQQIYLSKETRNIPSNKKSAKGLPEILAHFTANIDNTFDSLNVIEQWQVSKALYTAYQSIIIGQKTPEQAAKTVQDEKDRIIKESQNK
jgi:ABC-type glycerol-3-phosphate transport system substrate-binding protein